MQEQLRQTIPKVLALPPRQPEPNTTLHLYEQVVSKNFQILKNILPRIHSLYQLNEQLERSMSSLETRLTKMESDNENLHYEMRTNHLAIDSKLNNILAEYSNISTETGKIRKQTQLLSKELKESKAKLATEKNIRQNEEQQDTEQRFGLKKDKSRKIMFVDQPKNEEEQIEAEQEGKNKFFISRPKRKSSINIESQESQAPVFKVQFNLSEKDDEVSQRSVPENFEFSSKMMKSQKSISRKANLKTSKNISIAKESNSLVSQKNITKEKKGENSELQKFQKFLKEIESYHIHNQRMKKNYQELMAEYCKVHETQFAELQAQMKELSTRMMVLDPNNNSMESFKVNFQAKISETVGRFQEKLEERVGRPQWNDLIAELNKRLNSVHEERKKMANKDETKRAIEFIEKKINTVLEEYYEKQQQQQALQIVQVDKFGCFRTNKLPSYHPHERDLSELVQPHEPHLSHHQSAPTTKRQAESLHLKRLHGTFADNRFNQDLNQWRNKAEKADKLEDSASCRTRTHRRENTVILKKKSMQILSKEKPKVKPRLRRQRLIFEYE